MSTSIITVRSPDTKQLPDRLSAAPANPQPVSSRSSAVSTQVGQTEIDWAESPHPRSTRLMVAEATPTPELSENGPKGRLVVNVFIVVTLLAVVASNLPRQSSLGSFAGMAFGPYLRATGLEQRWNVFAPDPLPYTVYVSARIRYADGSSDSWSYPFGGSLIGAYRFYRWEKLSWRVNTDHAGSEFLREQLALWVLREIADPGRDPVAVELVRRYSDTPIPGSKDQRVWREITFYRLSLPTGAQASG